MSVIPGVTNGGAIQRGPTTNGSSGQVLTGDGAGNLAFSTIDVSGSLSLTESDPQSVQGPVTFENVAVFEDDVDLTGGTLIFASIADAEAAINAKLGGSTGSTDNRVLRADGTGAATVQNSPVTIDDSGNVTGVAALTASGALTAGGNASCYLTNAGGWTNVNGSNGVALTGTSGGVWCLAVNQFDTPGVGLGGWAHAARFSATQTVRVGQYTDATLPTAGTAGRIAYSSDSGLVHDNGTNWRKATYSNV